jgi:redox-sensitive bicupin YhaK (pirin superfamily)
MLKRLVDIRRNFEPHWVGDGFPVRSLFSYSGDAEVHDPFLLLDYAAPFEFLPGAAPRGVGEHPHRGFETVTIVYAGEVEHRDSSGGGGRIGRGDVQWMTAASGVVHEEFHGRDFARQGGLFEMVQLWVNLPARDKMAPPRYQGITSSEIPTVALPQGGGTVRVIAGEFAGTKGPAKTFTPIHVWDIRLARDHRTDVTVPDGYTTALVVLRGAVRIDGSDTIGAAEVGLFDRAGERIAIDCDADATALLLCGEPIVGQGPFVMNSAAEIRQAIADYQSGKMGHLGPEA